MRFVSVSSRSSKATRAPDCVAPDSRSIPNASLNRPMPSARSPVS